MPTYVLEANQKKNNCLVINFYNKLKFPALFSVRNRWEKSAGDFNLWQNLLTRQSCLDFPLFVDFHLLVNEMNGMQRKNSVVVTDDWYNVKGRHKDRDEFQDANWVPMTRNQLSRRPITTSKSFILFLTYLYFLSSSPPPAYLQYFSKLLPSIPSSYDSK